MGWMLQELPTPTLQDSGGAALTGMSNPAAGFAFDGYTSPITGVFGARGLIIEIKDTNGGAAVAPSACVVGWRNTGSSAWTEDVNFASYKHNGGNLSANFWRNPSARLYVIPVCTGSLPWAGCFVYDEAKVHMTIGATANVLTPVFRAWVLRDDCTYSPK